MYAIILLNVFISPKSIVGSIVRIIFFNSCTHSNSLSNLFGFFIGCKGFVERVSGWMWGVIFGV